MRGGHDSRTEPLGIHRSARSPADAPDESLARTALDSHLDDRRDADGRWMDLVRPGANAAGLWRAATVFGDWRRGVSRGFGHFCFQSAEKIEPAAEALPDRATLLVEGAASGQIFVSVRPHDDGVFHRAGHQLLLSFAGRRAFLFGAEHCGVPHRAGHALSE